MKLMPIKNNEEIKKKLNGEIFLILFLLLLAFIFLVSSDIITGIIGFIILSGVSLFLYDAYKSDSANKTILNLSLGQKFFSKEKIIFFIPIISSTLFLCSFHDVLTENRNLFEVIILTILLFFIFSCAGTELYFFFSHPRSLWIFKGFINFILKIYIRIRKKKPYNKEIYMLPDAEDLLGSILEDYFYFFAHLLVISFLSPLVFLNLYSESHSRLEEWISQEAWVFSSFFILIVISSILFSMHLSGFYWEKRVDSSIFYKLLIPSLIVFIAKISIKNNNQVGEMNLILATVFFIFVISALSFGFLFVREYCTKRIRESDLFKKT